MVIFKSRCYNGGNQHKFEPRYDEVPTSMRFRTEICYTPKQWKAILHTNVYIHDICAWCGKVISRQEKQK